MINAGSFSRNVHLFAIKTPTLYYSHSIWIRQISNKHKWTLERFLDSNHRVIAVSRAAFDLYNLHYFQGKEMTKQVSWIYNYVDDRFSKRALIKASTKPMIVLTLGTLASYKNPELWVRVAKNVLRKNKIFRELEFWWAGEGPLLAKAREAAEGHKEIRFLGFVPDPDNLYIQASLYFQPSEFENCSLAVCDAMMFGLPCVVTDCGGLPEQVINERNGFVVSESNEELIAEKILELINDEQKRSEMGDYSRKRYLEAFTESHWKTAFDRLVKEITT